MEGPSPVNFENGQMVTCWGMAGAFSREEVAQRLGRQEADSVARAARLGTPSDGRKCQPRGNLRELFLEWVWRLRCQGHSGRGLLPRDLEALPILQWVRDTSKVGGTDMQ